VRGQCVSPPPAGRLYPKIDKVKRLVFSRGLPCVAAGTVPQAICRSASVPAPRDCALPQTSSVGTIHDVPRGSSGTAAMEEEEGDAPRLSALPRRSSRVPAYRQIFVKSDTYVARFADGGGDDQFAGRPTRSLIATATLNHSSERVYGSTCRGTLDRKTWRRFSDASPRTQPMTSTQCRPRSSKRRSVHRVLTTRLAPVTIAV
jgi:hypothetical protein